MKQKLSKAPFIFLTAVVLIRQSVLFVLNLLFPPLGEPAFPDMMDRFEAAALRIQILNGLHSLLSISLLVFFLWTFWNLRKIMGSPSVGTMKKLAGYYACTIVCLFAMVVLFSALDRPFQGEYFYQAWTVSFYMIINMVIHLVILFLQRRRIAYTD